MFKKVFLKNVLDLFHNPDLEQKLMRSNLGWDAIQISWKSVL